MADTQEKDKAVGIAPAPMTPAPVVVTVIGSTGDGGASIADKTIGVTPDHMPNLLARTIPVARAVSIRAANVWITVFLSLTGLGTIATGVAGLAGVTVPTVDFQSALLIASLAALGEALKSLGTILSGLEKKYPVATGNL